MEELLKLIPIAVTALKIDYLSWENPNITSDDRWAEWLKGSLISAAGAYISKVKKSPNTPKNNSDYDIILENFSETKSCLDGILERSMEGFITLYPQAKFEYLESQKALIEISNSNLKKPNKTEE